MTTPNFLKDAKYCHRFSQGDHDFYVFSSSSCSEKVKAATLNYLKKSIKILSKHTQAKEPARMYRLNIDPLSFPHSVLLSNCEHDYSLTSLNTVSSRINAPFLVLQGGLERYTQDEYLHLLNEEDDTDYTSVPKWILELDECIPFENGYLVPISKVTGLPSGTMFPSKLCSKFSVALSDLEFSEKDGLFLIEDEELTLFELFACLP